VKDLVLPSSIQHLRLKFEGRLSKEILLKMDKDFVDDSYEEEPSKVFEENSLLRRFENSFKDLQALETLELFF